MGTISALAEQPLQMSLRAIERELGIHRATVRKYLDAEGPPTRRPWVGPATPSSDTMAA